MIATLLHTLRISEKGEDDQMKYKPYEHEGLTDFTVRPFRYRNKEAYHEYMSRNSKDNVYELLDDQVFKVLHDQGFETESAPRSVYTVEKLYDALAGYAPGKIQKLKPDDEFRAGVALARNCFKRPNDVPPLSVLPMTPDTVIKITSNPTGSAGLTNLGVQKKDSMSWALTRGLRTLRHEVQPEPCLAFHRTQFNGKTRLVWGYPYSMTIIEGLVAYELNEVFKGGCTPMAFAMSTLTLGTKLQVAAYHKKYCYSLDFSQFDATVSAGLIHEAFKILRTWYDLNSVEPISGVSVKEIFSIIERFFIRTTIVMPDGHIYIGKDHGVPSGSYFTQMIDSIVNVIICGAISSKFKLHVDKHDIFVLGDDLMFWSNRLMDLNTISKYIRDVYQMKVHGDEKSHIYRYDETIHYLGRDWTNGLPSLSQDEILKRMIYPETFRHYSKDDPDKRRDEVRKLILSYAAVYRNAWRIASRSLGGQRRNINCGCANVDVNTYCKGHGKDDLKGEFLSGLQRYMRKYFHDEVRGDIPLTATQFLY